MAEETSGSPDPFSVPWPRPSLSIVLTDPPGSVRWPSPVSSHLEDLAAQQGVELILPADQASGGDPLLRSPSVVECPEGEPDAGLCPRLRGVARAVGNVVVFREVGGASGPLLGLPPLWEPSPAITVSLGERLRAAGVDPLMPPAIG